jgi:hypothetical protein
LLLDVALDQLIETFDSVGNPGNGWEDFHRLPAHNRKSEYRPTEQKEQQEDDQVATNDQIR